MTRKAIGPKIRFEVFSRDGFRCHYCGATAQEAKLTIDHIRPVALGGNNSFENLVTACSSCNSGKSSNVIAFSPPTSRLSPFSTISYGITIESRSGVEQELSRMRNFAYEMFLRNLTKYIKLVWCDSKCGVFYIETFPLDISLWHELDIEWCACEFLGVCNVFGRDIFPSEEIYS